MNSRTKWLAYLLLLIPLTVWAYPAGTQRGVQEGSEGTIRGGAAAEVRVLYLEFEASDTTEFNGVTYTINGNDVSNGDTTGTIGSTAEMSTDQAVSGTTSLLIPGDNDYFQFDAFSGGTIFSSVSGYFSTRLYISANPAVDTTFFQPRLDASNMMYFDIETDGGIEINWISAGNTTKFDTVATINTPAWNFIEVRWDINNADWGGHIQAQINVNSAGWESEADADVAVGWESDQDAKVNLGNFDQASGDDYYLDDFTIWPAWDKSGIN